MALETSILLMHDTSFVFTGNHDGLYDTTASSTFNNLSTPIDTGLVGTGVFAQETVNMDAVIINQAMVVMVE